LDTPTPTPIVSESQLERILAVIDSSWAQSTKESYGAGLLLFHIFCDTHSIPEDQRCPVEPTLLLSFLSSCAGSYSGSTLSNYAAALRAWHLLHGRPWLVQPNELKAILDGATALAPPSSKRQQRLPFSPDLICAIRHNFNLANPLDAAVFACLTTTFYAIARLGEFTVPSTKHPFDPQKHISRSGISDATDRNNLQVKKFCLPRTKSSASGEDAFWAAQTGPSDPKAALENHLLINPAGPNDHLFAWMHPSAGLRPLSKYQFLKRMSAAATASNIPNFKGHSLRIGGTLEYLLRGVPFDVVKSMGRWSGESFTIYLRHHANILAPYLQASPALEPFIQRTIAMLPVR